MHNKPAFHFHLRAKMHYVSNVYLPQHQNVILYLIPPAICTHNARVLIAYLQIEKSKINCMRVRTCEKNQQSFN